jgi:hypothetical protein
MAVIRGTSILLQRQPKLGAQGGINILSDYFFGDESEPLVIFVFECNGILAGVEVYGLAGDAPTSLPDIESLRPYGPEPAGQ